MYVVKRAARLIETWEYLTYVCTVYITCQIVIKSSYESITGIGKPEKYAKAAEDAILALHKFKDQIKEDVYHNLMEKYKMATKNLQQKMETLYTFDQKEIVNTSNVSHIGTEFIMSWQVNDHRAIILGDIC